MRAARVPRVGERPGASQFWCWPTDARRTFLWEQSARRAWPRTTGFTFDLTATKFLGAGPMAVAIAPWTSTGYAEDGSPFDRPGRATMVFRREPEGWLCVHSHMSLNRGVPQASHGNRPVVAWPPGMP